MLRIKPQFLLNRKGKRSQVYLSIEDFNKIYAEIDKLKSKCIKARLEAEERMKNNAKKEI